MENLTTISASDLKYKLLSSNAVRYKKDGIVLLYSKCDESAWKGQREELIKLGCPETKVDKEGNHFLWILSENKIVYYDNRGINDNPVYYISRLLPAEQLLVCSITEEETKIYSVLNGNILADEDGDIKIA